MVRRTVITRASGVVEPRQRRFKIAYGVSHGCSVPYAPKAPGGAPEAHHPPGRSPRTAGRSTPPALPSPLPGLHRVLAPIVPTAHAVGYSQSPLPRRKNPASCSSDRDRNRNSHVPNSDGRSSAAQPSVCVPACACPHADRSAQADPRSSPPQSVGQLCHPWAHPSPPVVRRSHLSACLPVRVRTQTGPHRQIRGTFSLRLATLRSSSLLRPA